MIVVGADPGQTGALVALSGDGELADWMDMPINDGKILEAREILNWLIGLDKLEHCFIEKVHSMPGQGVSSTFKFGRSYGALYAAVQCVEVEIHDLTPQSWKKSMGLIGQGKDSARLLALEMWPEADIFHRKKDIGRADAALIAAVGLEKIKTGML